jgi:hypothetical protein
MAANERQFPDYAVAAGIVIAAPKNSANIPRSIAKGFGHVAKMKSNVTNPNGIVAQLNGGVTN